MSKKKFNFHFFSAHLARLPKCFFPLMSVVYLLFSPGEGLSGIAFSDSLFLKDGSVITGQILKATEHSIDIETSVGLITYRIAVIKRIFYEKGLAPAVPLTEKEIKEKTFQFTEKNKMTVTPYVGLFAPGTSSNYSDVISFAFEVQRKIVKNYSINLFASYNNSSISDSVREGHGITLIEGSVRYTQYGYDVLPYFQVGLGTIFLNIPGGKTENSISFSIGAGICIIIARDLGLNAQYRLTTARFPTYETNPAGFYEKQVKLNSSSSFYIGLTFYLN